MPAEALLLAGVMLLGLVLYFLLGGADFGGGVWDLLASGPRKAEQRELVGHAIGPVWEANHVWLIFAVVMLFSGFQRAFSAISVALHVPLTLFLLGVVMRGSAFAFRGALYGADRQQRHWGRVFAWASLAAPVFLGMSVGAIASGRIRVEHGVVQSGFFETWLQPFPVVIGLFALAQCAFLAAVFLAYEAQGELKEDFRQRALIAGIVVGLLAMWGILLSRSGAPVIYEGLLHRKGAWLFHGITALAALTALHALYKRNWASARFFAALQIGLVLFGWVAAQYPYLVVPDLTLATAASARTTQRAILYAVAAGLPILGPSLWLLFRIFKPPQRAA